ncbi:MAG: wax ester/triacylglycerol synthase family O-acyltransferase [Actinomycetota bacterium]|nr:wax ester/triacylglycerol synthase family O-acyltransferase [Actinomycetota bacterium]
MSTTTRHMSDEDALMWNIEKDPVLRSTIVAVATFAETPDWERLRDRVDRASRVIPRFRDRVLSPPMRIAPPRWTTEPSFDLDYHLRRVRSPAPGDEQALLAVLRPITAAAFDRARPLWEFTLIEGLEGGRAALAMKVHHSVTDGVGGMALLTELVDLERDPVANPDAAMPAVPAPESFTTTALVRDSFAHNRRRTVGIVSRVPGTMIRGTGTALRDPIGTMSEFVRTARSIARTLAPATAPLSPIMRNRGLARELAMFEVSLDELRRAAKVAEGSVNDAFVAAVVGGLRRYHERHGTELHSLRMTMPINLRTSADEKGGNRFAPARFPVPAGAATPVARMQSVRGLVKDWRAEPALQMTSTLAGILNRLPTATTTALFGGMLKCCDFVATNVPGAPIPVYSAGSRVDGLYAFAPTAGAAVNVSLISHCDTCCIGVVVDTTAVPDPAALVACLREGFDEVLAQS